MLWTKVASALEGLTTEQLSFRHIWPQNVPMSIGYQEPKISSFNLHLSIKDGIASFKTKKTKMKHTDFKFSLAILPGILYNWYFLQAFNFRYFRASHDSAKITSIK